MTIVPYGIVYLTSRVFRGEVVKRYIGQHKIYNGVVDDGYLGSGKLIRRAIKKHGKACFTREVLQVCYSRKELDKAEVKWIEHYKAVTCSTFYNLVDGGSLGNGEHLRKEVHQYTLNGDYLATHRSVVAAAKSVGCAEAHMTDSCKTPGKSAKGFQWKFTKALKIAAVKGGKRGVCCYDSEGVKVRVFSTVLEGAFFIGEKRTGNVSACCTGKKRSAGGYQWRHQSDNLNFIEPLKKKRLPTKCISQFDRDGNKLKVFNSLTEAASSVKVPVANITRSATSGYAAGGFYWRYED